ncbi:hypothetical protein PHLGIDRAFT_173935 [Phlebiopsis gigantea 11061_1 CR5-6]|uniref:Cupin type-1 domain-containing protein n=1 Tax=Phlebiopsis gigantea (strain 11061_1 CR5-6) TaxID=745531 RepID=A0A0C3SEW7_PHLG1|nr:hypothetical protein PHLGIDRAFT_173935 [Phlebiopsis gigantea 11061_1 CR5-6]
MSCTATVPPRDPLTLGRSGHPLKRVGGRARVFCIKPRRHGLQSARTFVSFLRAMLSSLSLTLSLALGMGAAAQTVADKVAMLRLAPTEVDRIKLLSDDDFTFDFLHQSTGVTTGGAGHTVAASSGNFPALIGNGMAMTVGFLGPCGMNTPHVHPRATEFNFVVNGTLSAGLLVENGARFVAHDLQSGQAAVFPRGAIHFEFNNGCEPAMFVAAFNDEDPGVDQVAQRFFGLPPAIVDATLGGIGVEQVAGLESKIPDNIALGSDECLQRCGISRGNQPTNQRQARVSANALPSGFSGPSVADSPPATATYSLPSFSPSPATPTGSSSQQTSNSDAVRGGASIVDSNGKPDPLVLSLLIVVCALAAGYVALAIVWCVRRRREKTDRTRGMKYFKTGPDFAPQGAIFEAEKAQPFERYSGAHDSERITPYDAPSGGA